MKNWYQPDVSVVAQSVVPCEESVRGEEVVELKKPTVETSSAKMIQSSPIAVSTVGSEHDGERQGFNEYYSFIIHFSA